MAVKLFDFELLIFDKLLPYGKSCLCEMDSLALNTALIDNPLSIMVLKNGDLLAFTCIDLKDFASPQETLEKSVRELGCMRDYYKLYNKAGTEMGRINMSITLSCIGTEGLAVHIRNAMGPQLKRKHMMEDNQCQTQVEQARTITSTGCSVMMVEHEDAETQYEIKKMKDKETNTMPQKRPPKILQNLLQELHELHQQGQFDEFMNEQSIIE